MGLHITFLIALGSILTPAVELRGGLRCEVFLIEVHGLERRVGDRVRLLFVTGRRVNNSGEVFTRLALL